MANSNSKKINMNKKQIEKTLGKKNNTSANAKKGTSNNKNKKPVSNKPVVNKPEESTTAVKEVKTNVNTPIVNNTKVKSETKKPVEASTTPPKKVVAKKETDKKQAVKKIKTKPKKKVDKKDVFKVNRDGSLYDLSSIYPKKKQDKKKVESLDNTTTGLKGTFFEELSEKEELEKKQETKKNFKKLAIFLGVVAVLLLVGSLGYKKYKQYVKAHLRVYEEYKIGSTIKTPDGSLWYVVEYSDKSNPKIKLLNDGRIDINNDGVLDDNDKMRFSTDSSKYDKTDATSLAYFLFNNYKGIIEKKVGFEIDDIDLMTSKEFVRVRDYLGYGYEWTEGNFLASYDIGYYWINSENEKLYAVGPRGTYRMSSKETLYFVRCVITVSKDNLKIFVDNEG